MVTVAGLGLQLGGHMANVGTQAYNDGLEAVPPVESGDQGEGKARLQLKVSSFCVPGEE